MTPMAEERKVLFFRLKLTGAMPDGKGMRSRDPDKARPRFEIGSK